MSVIFGIHESERIIIVADNRTTNKDGEIVCDNSKKIYPIHSGLCIAMAGHRLLSKRVNDNIKKYIVDTQKILTTDDLSVIITQFFDKLNAIEKDIFPLSFSCAYGGINNKNKANLIFGSYNNNNKKYEYKEVTHYDIFSPTDANAKHCYGTLMLNCVQMKKTILKLYYTI